MRFLRIKSLREDNDLSQNDIAQILRIPQRTYSGYETGTRKVPIKSLMELARYYNTSIDYIVGMTDEKVPYPVSHND